MVFQPKTKEELKYAIQDYLWYKEEEGIKKYGVMNSWDVSLITDMSYLFKFYEGFNLYINDWDVSNVTNMEHMFCNCFNFNQDLSNWNVSNVTNMSYMFGNCLKFNQPLDNWDVSNVTDMYGAFSFCESFNQKLNSWNVSNVTNMAHMFFRCTNFNKLLDKWDVSNVIDMKNMFYGCENNNRFNITHDPKETIIVNKLEKCIICLEEKEVYNKLCNKNISNDHYYCDECFDESNTTQDYTRQCLICRTPSYHIKYVFKLIN